MKRCMLVLPIYNMKKIYPHLQESHKPFYLSILALGIRILMGILFQLLFASKIRSHIHSLKPHTNGLLLPRFPRFNPIEQKPSQCQLEVSHEDKNFGKWGTTILELHQNTSQMPIESRRYHLLRLQATQKCQLNFISGSLDHIQVHR